MLLLDTHVLVWLVEGIEHLGRRTARRADAALVRHGVAVASISFWEVAMLTARGRLSLDLAVAEWRLRVLGLGVQELPLTGDIAIEAATLGDLHADPADRIIVATALAAQSPLVTADDRILRWRGRLECHDARR